ncbi:MAG: hypothetical protein ACJAT2_000687 [Bacteriovoracaceae bacterium]|jgi:hypothetical protein
MKNLTFLFLFFFSFLEVNAGTKERISEINSVLSKHAQKDYFYKSRALINLLNEKTCLLRLDSKVEELESLEDCKAFGQDKSLGKIAAELHLFEKKSRECGNDCSEIKESVQRLEATYLLKLIKLAPGFLSEAEVTSLEEDCLRLRVKPSVSLSSKKSCKRDPNSKAQLEMGINLTAPQAESPSVGNAVPFADIFKTARPFESDRPDLVKEKNGWPCFNKKGDQVKTNLLQSAVEGSIPNGIYPVHYSGDVSLSVKGAELMDCPDGKKRSKNNSKRKCLKVSIDKKLGGNGITVNIKGESENSCLEDLKIILPGDYEARIEESPEKTVFNQAYLDYLKPFKVIRTMNLMYASPRMPEVCRKMQASSIEKNPKKYNWNTLSSEAKSCLTDTNYDRTSDNRAKLTDATWGVSHDTDKRNWRGVPMEVMVDLIDQTKANPWINIPHNASKEYVRELAGRLKKLKEKNPNIKINVEYSNEVWNGRFWGSKYINAATVDPHPNESRGELISRINSLSATYKKERASAGANMDQVKAVVTKYNGLLSPLRVKLQEKTEAEVKTYVDKSVEVFDIFESELGEESIIRTLGTNQKDPNRTKSMLRILKGRGELDKVDAVATATYFHGCWGNSQKEGGHCKKFLKDKKGMYDARTEEDLLDTLLNPENPEGVDHVLGQVKKQNEVLISDDFKEAGIDLVAYEGGQHLTLDTMPADLKAKITPEKKKALIGLIHKANKHKKMGEIYEKLYKGWSKNGGKTHINFIMAQSQSQYGSFGLSTHLNDKDSSEKYLKAQKYSEIYCDK